MNQNKHDEINASMLCVIAFTIGLLLAFAGCKAANKTQAEVFDNQVEFGGGLYLQEGVN